MSDARPIADGPEDADRSPIDATALALLLESLGDAEAVEEIVVTFIEQAERLENELDRAADVGDERSVRRVAHTLRSAALVVGARQLAVACAALEAHDAIAGPEYDALAEALHRASRDACEALRRRE